MPKILHIETSAEACSISISENSMLLAQRETIVERSHAHLLNIFIIEALEECSLKLSDMDALSVSKGPGSYTGLRIGVSTIKGLCYSLDKPLLSVSTLDAMAECIGGIIQGEFFIKSNIANSFREATEKALENIVNRKNLLLIPMIDARRDEVYAGVYDLSGKQIRGIQADIVDEQSYLPFLENSKVLFFGPGAIKCKLLINHTNALFAENIYPSSIQMIKLAEQAFSKKNFEDIAYFEPFYLKNFTGSIPTKKPLRI